MVVARLQTSPVIPATNVVGGESETPHTMIDFNNMHQIVTHRVPATTRISTFLVLLISFILILVIFAICVMCTSYLRRKLKKRDGNNTSLFCRSETSETLIESTLINSENPTTYSAIDV